jgi:succinate dehydrogenase/fumarate reductase flavoprotein subunit
MNTPENCQQYFYITADGSIGQTRFYTCTQDMDRLHFGNCFRTQDSAEQALKKIKEILNSNKEWK